jgi:hypothetical protein
MVGYDWKTRADVLVIGSAYSPFFGTTARSAAMPLVDYSEARTPGEFLRSYVSNVVVPDPAYYGKLGQLLTGMITLSRSAFTDLARVAFVSRKPDGSFEAGDATVTRSRVAYRAYVSASEDWTWRRMQVQMGVVCRGVVHIRLIRSANGILQSFVVIPAVDEGTHDLVK